MQESTETKQPTEAQLAARAKFAEAAKARSAAKKETVQDLVTPAGVKTEVVEPIEMVLITTEHEVTINGVKYPVGKHKLPEDVAEEVSRISSDYAKNLAKLNIKHTYNHNAGTVAVGGGAE